MTFYQFLVVVSCAIIIYVELRWMREGNRRIAAAEAYLMHKAMTLDKAAKDLDVLIAIARNRQQ